MRANLPKILVYQELQKTEKASQRRHDRCCLDIQLCTWLTGTAINCREVDGEVEPKSSSRDTDTQLQITRCLLCYVTSAAFKPTGHLHCRRERDRERERERERGKEKRMFFAHKQPIRNKKARKGEERKKYTN